MINVSIKRCPPSYPSHTCHITPTWVGITEKTACSLSEGAERDWNVAGGLAKWRFSLTSLKRSDRKRGGSSVPFSIWAFSNLAKPPPQQS